MLWCRVPSFVWAVAVFATLTNARELHAQDAAPLAPPAAAAAPTAPDAASSEADRNYHLAFLALADGDVPLARSLLQQVLAKHPQHALAERARNVLMLLASPAKVPAPQAADAAEQAPGLEDASELPAHLRHERPSASARSELIFVQTAHGFALGAELCAIAGCEDGRAWVAGLALGAGTGFGVSFVASRDGVEAGLSRALTDGTLWGLAHGGMILLATDATRGVADETPLVNAHLAIGQLAGLGLAGAVYSQLEPTVGQVSATSSAGVWTVALTAQVLGALETELDEQQWAAALLAASDVGLIAGGLFAAHHPMSASRALMIDAGGLLGGLGGLGVGVLAQDDPQRTPTFVLGAVGTLSGLGLTYYLTRNWDDDARGSNARLSVVPVAGGAMARAHLRF